MSSIAFSAITVTVPALLIVSSPVSASTLATSDVPPSMLKVILPVPLPAVSGFVNLYPLLSQVTMGFSSINPKSSSVAFSVSVTSTLPAKLVTTSSITTLCL